MNFMINIYRCTYIECILKDNDLKILFGHKIHYTVLCILSCTPLYKDL